MNRGVLAGLGPGDAPDVLSSDAGQNAVLVAGSRKEVAYSTTTSQAVATADCSGYRFVSVHGITQNGTGTFQMSNDGVNWVSFALIILNGAGPSGTNAQTTSSAGNIYGGPLVARYFRINFTGVSGTCSGVVELYATPPPMYTMTGVSLSTTAGVPSDGLTIAGLAAGTVMAVDFRYNGTSWDRLRGLAVFKTATATASGDTALWTPTTGKKFRLMRYRIDVTANAALAAGAELDVVLRDATTATSHAMSLFVPMVGGAVMGMATTGWVDLGNGQLSATINNVLNINLSASLTAGKVRVLAAGTEE